MYIHTYFTLFLFWNFDFSLLKITKQLIICERIRKYIPLSYTAFLKFRILSNEESISVFIVWYLSFCYILLSCQIANHVSCAMQTKIFVILNFMTPLSLVFLLTTAHTFLHMYVYIEASRYVSQTLPTSMIISPKQFKYLHALSARRLSLNSHGFCYFTHYTNNTQLLLLEWMYDMLCMYMGMCLSTFVRYRIALHPVKYFSM